ncbi:MAG: protoporphyrinogen/coproporphyrinogen oxidase [Actinomycetota bacterium]|jgi:oxygen-dependent protoporphyrinogen oxidase|nr:protoporphyrinogen/coproporphyrinogen oxidase [Actinomycetota bacterium]
MAGLAAAYALRDVADVIVVEASSRVGGKLRVSDVGGVAVDEGADSMLRRVPQGVDLAVAAGLGDELTSPATGAAFVRARGRLLPLPTGTVLGVPADLTTLARSDVLSARGLARVPLDLVLPGRPVTDDVSVGELVGRRLGREVVELLVDPLLGGVYAGRADRLSLQATMPQLAAALTTHRSLVLAARAARGTASGLVFAGLPGGLGRLPAAVAAASGATIKTGTTVRALDRTPTGWQLTTGSTADPSYLEANAVVLAVPAAPAARLLRDVAPTAAGQLAGIDYASVAIVTLVLDGETPGRGSGYLVPAVEGLTTKAVTFTSRKWSLPGPAVVRASVGRYGDEVELQREDGELVRVVLAELERIVGPVGPLVDSRVTRWGGGLPQYAVGHLDRVRRIKQSLPAGLAVAGAAYDGVGVPAVIKSGQDAAAGVLLHNGVHDGRQA